MELIRKKEITKGRWLVYLKDTTTCCNNKRIVLEFFQTEEPNEEEIKESYENRKKRN